MPVDPPSLNPFQLNDLEENIWDAVGEKVMTGEEVAAACRCKSLNSNFKNTLSSMRKRGILVNIHPGYKRASNVEILRPSNAPNPVQDKSQDNGQDKGQD